MVTYRLFKQIASLQDKYMRVGISYLPETQDLVTYHIFIQVEIYDKGNKQKKCALIYVFKTKKNQTFSTLSHL